MGSGVELTAIVEILRRSNKKMMEAALLEALKSSRP
jgi:hypothetical protein